MDIVPVDIVVNGMIMAAWYTATHKNGHKAKIYQITTSSTNPVTWADMGKYNSIIYLESLKKMRTLFDPIKL